MTLTNKNGDLSRRFYWPEKIFRDVFPARPDIKIQTARCVRLMP